MTVSEFSKIFFSVCLINLAIATPGLITWLTAFGPDWIIKINSVGTKTVHAGVGLSVCLFAFMLAGFSACLIVSASGERSERINEEKRQQKK